MQYTLLKSSYNRLYWCREINQFYLINNCEDEQIYLNDIKVLEHENIIYNFPLNLVWRITSKCNLACPHCFSTDNKKTALEEEEVRKAVLNDILLLVPPKINFTGGEPILTDNFLDILKKLKQKNIITTLTSNGLILDQYLFDIIDYIDWFIISIDHYLPEVHDYLRKKNGLYEKSIEIVKKLISMNKMTRVNSVISKKNFYDIENMVRHFRTIGIHCYELIQFMPKNKAVNVSSEYAIDENLFLEKANELKVKYQTNEFKIKINSNSTFKEYMVIEDDGFLYTVDSDGLYNNNCSILESIKNEYKYNLPVLGE